MKWNEIYEKYPKAFGLFEEEYLLLGDKYEIEDSNIIIYDYERFDIPVGEFFNIRDLYDFFDDKDIYMEVEVILWEEQKKMAFSWYIVIDLGQSDEDFIEPNDRFNSRKKAEAIGFENAFKVLEERLGSKKIMARIIRGFILSDVSDG